MAEITYVPQGKSSMEQRTEELDAPEQDQEAPELVSLLVQVHSDHIKVTEQFDRNGRTSKRNVKFAAWDEARKYVDECLDAASGEDEEEEDA